jgi:glyoxylase-like metal-dependent hydrolase (beta-lactamase superfamily II)/ferredoxin
MLGTCVARISARLSDNAAGDFFVDAACIDCGTCRVLAPEVFRRSDRLGLSVVGTQPTTQGQALRAKMALISCPTSAIGTQSKVPLDDAMQALPDPILEDVLHCGYAAESSYGAQSYLVRRAGGNVLVDSPRAARPLMDRIEELGGARTMFLSHVDDVADHEQYARRFGCRRVIRAEDVRASTRGAEQVLERAEPEWLAPDLLAIPVPGHTRGSMVLLYRGQVLFTGDHLWGSDGGGGLDAGRDVCWYSWEEQARSMERLLAFDFEWVLPGHGPRFHAPVPRMRAELEKLVARMKA